MSIPEAEFDLIWAVVKKEAMANQKKRNIDYLLYPDSVETK